MYIISKGTLLAILTLLEFNLVFAADLNEIINCEKKSIFLNAIYNESIFEGALLKSKDHSAEYPLIADWSKSSGKIIAITNIPKEIISVQIIYTDKNNIQKFKKNTIVKNKRIEVDDWNKLTGEVNNKEGKVTLTLHKKDSTLCSASVNIYDNDEE